MSSGHSQDGIGLYVLHHKCDDAFDLIQNKCIGCNTTSVAMNTRD